MFTIEDFLRISNQMRDYYAKKIKDSFQEFNFSPNEISILIVLKNNPTITTSTELKVVLGVGKINKTLFYDVSVEEMKNLKQTMSKLQKRVEER